MEKSQKDGRLRLKELPGPLQQKFKNSLAIDNGEFKGGKPLNFDLKKLQQRKIEKQKTMEQKLSEYKIDPIEQKYLLGVFRDLSAPNKGEFFTKVQVSAFLRKMGIKLTKAEIDLMIWEFDQDLNKRISEKEFINMYKKCTIDKTGAQSKNLFHFTQFLMYCRPGYYHITVQDTLELLYVRAKKEADALKTDVKDLFQDQIRAIFGPQRRNPDQVDQQIDFKQYLEKINKRAIEKRKLQLFQSRSNLRG